MAVVPDIAVEVIQFTEDNADEVSAFIGDAGEAHNGPSFVKLNKFGFDGTWGPGYAVPGDWVFRVAGHLYIVPPALLAACALVWEEE